MVSLAVALQLASDLVRPPLPLPYLNSFMKLRLDRVLKADLAGMPEEEIFKSSSNYELPAFDKPLGSEKWRAPYSPYEAGWWEAFYKK